ncbi:hypothetical protein H311_02401 [Anncaliia algerae PRA109]|nr:hypothetical protein H311_02401 [Anncaliia algerae PRA109]
MSPRVLDGININTRELLIVKVRKRNSGALKTVILENVLSRSLTVIDKWRGYWGLEDIG